MPKQDLALKGNRRLFLIALWATMFLALVPLGAVQAKAQSATDLQRIRIQPQDAIVSGPGKAHVVQDQAWLQAKNEHRVFRQGQKVFIVGLSLEKSLLIPTHTPILVQRTCGIP